MSENILNITNDIAAVKAIENLYVDTFSKGDAAQWIDLGQLRQYLNRILQSGFAIQILKPDQGLVACLLYSSFEVDSDCPQHIKLAYNINRSAYIAEVMVFEQYRGMGLGKQLLTAFFKHANRLIYDDVFIRVWDKNVAAIQLYQKMGFEVIADVFQSKKTISGNDEFVMKKFYLHKKL